MNWPSPFPNHNLSFPVSLWSLCSFFCLLLLVLERPPLFFASSLWAACCSPYSYGIPPLCVPVDLSLLLCGCVFPATDPAMLKADLSPSAVAYESFPVQGCVGVGSCARSRQNGESVVGSVWGLIGTMFDAAPSIPKVTQAGLLADQRAQVGVVAVFTTPKSLKTSRSMSWAWKVAVHQVQAASTHIYILQR